MKASDELLFNYTDGQFDYDPKKYERYFKTLEGTKSARIDARPKAHTHRNDGWEDIRRQYIKSNRTDTTKTSCIYSN